jgi:hypothetical protein
LKTNHKQGFWSYLNLTLPDHEMGLVNFQQLSMIEIENYTKSHNSSAKRDLGILCSAWQDLQTQQKRRIRSSIGMGFASAIVCGVGIWSGVGTAPAAALCSFSFADGLWGARRGYLDSQLAHNSFYAGREFFLDGTFADGVLSKGRSLELENQADVVMLINLLGVIPVIKAVATAGKVGRGSILSLFKLPTNDVAGSALESKSASLAYIMMSLRGVEAVQEEFALDYKELEAKLLN